MFHTSAGQIFVSQSFPSPSWKKHIWPAVKLPLASRIGFETADLHRMHHHGGGVLGWSTSSRHFWSLNIRSRPVPIFVTNSYNKSRNALVTDYEENEYTNEQFTNICEAEHPTTGQV